MRILKIHRKLLLVIIKKRMGKMSKKEMRMKEIVMKKLEIARMMK